MKNQLIYIILAIATSLSVLTSGCSHDTEEFDGPSLLDRFGPFRLVDSLQVSMPEVDFETGQTVFFTASFNKRINWVIQIKGEESGAVKEITGFTKELNAENASWNGTTTDLPLFRAELCEVKLIVPEEDSLTQTAVVTVLTSRVYEGNLMTDFEESSPSIAVRNFEFEFTSGTGVTGAIPAGQGQKSLLLEGTDGVVDNFFVGLIEVKANITGETFVPMPSTIPEDVYFNAFIYGTGDPYTIAIFDFYADNGDEIYNANNDQQFTTGNIDVTWEGWRQYSIQMSELGISEEQMSQIVGMRAVLISDNSSQPTPRVQVSFATDFWTFTKDQPLTP